MSPSTSYLKVGTSRLIRSSLIFLIPTQEGKVFAVKGTKLPGIHVLKMGTPRMALKPLDLLRVLPYFPGSVIASDLAALLCDAGDAQSFEPLSAQELWSAMGDATDEADRAWKAGNVEIAKKAEAHVRDFKARHQHLIAQTLQKEVDRAA
jgi:hypothetical protein